MIDTLNLLKEILCCAGLTKGIPKKYLTDVNNHKDKGIFIASTLPDTSLPTSFEIVVRGTKNKAEDSIKIAKEIYQLNNTLITIEINEITYEVDTILSEFINDGVDDQGRLSMSTICTMIIYERK